MIGNLFRPLNLERVVIDHANADLLVRSDGFSNRFQIDTSRARRFESNDVAIERVEHVEARGIALHLRVHALLGWVAPAGMRPDLGLTTEPFDRLIEELNCDVEAEGTILGS